MTHNVDGQSAETPDMMRGAWIVETAILALVLLLVGKYFGIAITLYALLGALALAAIGRVCVDLVRRHFG